ncbi:hypothetical protein ACVWYS_002182 [Arthrobacter sp. TE12231]
MTAKTTAPSTLEDGGALELVHIPAWEARYTLGQDPDELAHMVCCRDLDWRKTFCGHQEAEPVILQEATTLCTMCVEAVGGPGSPIFSRSCPFDNQPCPDEEELDRPGARRAALPARHRPGR